MANSVAENVLGLIGTIFWTCQVIPQIWKSWREKSTEGLSPWLMFIWSVASIFFGAYVVVQNVNIPIILQPQLFGVLAAFSWIQCLYYARRRSLRFCTVLFLSYLLAFGGLEVGFRFAVQENLDHGHDGLLTFCAVFGAILITAGFIPQYLQIWRHAEVMGISLIFMAVDMSGALFSLLSLCFKTQFYAVAALTYISVLVFDGGIVFCAFVLNPRAQRKRRAALAASRRADVALPAGSDAQATDTAVPVVEPVEAAITTAEKHVNLEQTSEGELALHRGSTVVAQTVPKEDIEGREIEVQPSSYLTV